MVVVIASSLFSLFIFIELFSLMHIIILLFTFLNFFFFFFFGGGEGGHSLQMVHRP